MTPKTAIKKMQTTKGRMQDRKALLRNSDYSIMPILKSSMKQSNERIVSVL